MSNTQKALVCVSGTLLMALVAFGVYSWMRVLQTIPYSSSCATTLVQISKQSAIMRPFLLGAFILCGVTLEFSLRQLRRGWRFAYVGTLGLGAALLVAPWIVDLFCS